MPIPVYLNEHSLSVQNFTAPEKLEIVLGFINTLITAKEKRSDLELHNTSSLYECDIGAGDYLSTILKGNNFYDQWRFIRSLAQRAPWDVNNLAINILLNGKPAVGLALALENKSAAVSLASEQAWKNNKVEVSIAASKEVVPNLSAPEHVNFWSELFRDFGVHVSASSVVFRGDFLIRMYQREHNPPHVHVEFAEHAATVDIRTLDTLGGRLPQHILGDVTSWINQNQAQLLLSWERCRAGSHPLVIQ
jgi:hypothetical protein